jgi:hypothetical protein
MHLGAHRWNYMGEQVRAAIPPLKMFMTRRAHAKKISDRLPAVASRVTVPSLA